MPLISTLIAAPVSVRRMTFRPLKSTVFSVTTPATATDTAYAIRRNEELFMQLLRVLPLPVPPYVTMNLDTVSAARSS